MQIKLFKELCQREHPLACIDNIYEPSQTIPNMDMRPQEIIERYVRHLPVPISYRQTFVLPDNLSEDEALDYVACADEFEVFDLQQRLKFDVEKKRADFLRRQQQHEHEKDVKDNDVPEPETVEDSPES